MTLTDLLPSFDLECARITGDMIKTAQQRAPAKKPSAADKVEAHHYSDLKDWGAFEKNMKGKKFRQAVFASSMSDDKLKAFVKANGEYQTSKDVVGLVPSRTSKRMYQIKRIAGGRLACGCKDWHYKKSHEGGPCEHIRELAQGLKEKVSSVMSGVIRGVAAARTMERAQKSHQKGKTMQENVKRLRLGQPLAPVQR